MPEIKRFNVRVTARTFWSSRGFSSGVNLPAFSLYYGSNDWEHLLNSLASAYTSTPLFFWEAREDLVWPGSTEYSHFGAPYRSGCVPAYQVDSPAVRGTSILLPEGDELVNPCVVCNYRADLLSGGCALFNIGCEKRGEGRWTKLKEN